MAISRTAQTSYRHENREVQREFERISQEPSKAVIQKESTASTVVGSNTPVTTVESQTYTVSHNYDSIGPRGLNRQTNYIDDPTGKIGQRHDVIFELEAFGSTNEVANVKGYVLIEGAKWYKERFVLDTPFPETAEVAVSEENVMGIFKYGTPTFHDIYHNLNLPDMYDFIYTLHYVGTPDCYPMPIVYPMSNNMVRVEGTVVVEKDARNAYGNTSLAPNASGFDYIEKFSNYEFIIVIEAKDAN